MSVSSSNATSPSTSSRPSTLGTGMVKSGSSRSIFRDNNRTPISRSRQNTVGLADFAEDLINNRNIGSDYQDIQIRTLTKWINAQLSTADESIKDIKTDLRDGKKLLKLLSIISKEPAPKPERMNMRIHQLANVAQALSFLEKQVGKENMPDIGNEAIVNGDAKKTLALIFFIMLKYQIQLVLAEHGEDFLHSLSELSERENGQKTISTDFNNVMVESSTTLVKASAPSLLSAARHKTSSQTSISDKLQQYNTSTTSSEAKIALLYWVRIQLEDYIVANMIPSIQDFSRSWRNGVAFCLLIHRHNPAYIPDLFNIILTNTETTLDKETKNDLNEKSTWHQLLKLAFTLATEKMDIQAYLEPEDLIDVDYPHEPSVMMYVSEYYRVMSQYQSEEPITLKHERAAKRKATIIMATGGTIDHEEDDEEIEHAAAEEESRCESPLLFSQGEESIAASSIKTMHGDDDTTSHSSKRAQPPTPIPAPSTRRKKKMAQRESTLGEEDKARIKADLNSKLLMQLTGHLPRGVHPTLDELLTIHETVLSFIKSNTKTIDEIPEEFVSSASVTEYVDALEIIEEQAEVEVLHLDTAKHARDLLTSAPETADDTLIRLTDLQRTQVSKLYDMLEKEWNQFIELLKTTKDDLLSVESALIDNEEGAEEYQAHADVLKKDLDEYRVLLSQVAPKSLSESKSHVTDDDVSRNENHHLVSLLPKLHPLDGSEHVATEYKQRLQSFSEKFVKFQETTWKEFRRKTRQLPRAVMNAVSSLSNKIVGKYDSLVLDLEKERQCCNNFERGLLMVDIVHAVESELETIQAIMEDEGQEKATTNDAIQFLEGKVTAVRSTLFNAKEEYDDLLSGDQRLATFFSNVQTRYETVSKWVDQVRIWFVEAERISSWIEQHIEALNHQVIEINPLAKDVMSIYDKSITDQMCQEHKKLKREIERFNNDDMTRLRSHVKSLTNSSNHNLSPADATTIEITLKTLNTLNKLMSLLQTRSKVVDTLQTRVVWEEWMAKVDTWCLKKNDEIGTFIHGKARWVDPDDEDTATVNSHYNRQLTEEVIAKLVSLENSIAECDKGNFTKVLDKYQEMEELEDVLPEHLELRQEEFERSFESIMKRCSFSRKVVEQHLVLTDIAAQFKKLRLEGEKLKSAMDHSNSTSTDDPSVESNSFHEHVQTFKENSSHWVTLLTKRVPYPDPESANIMEDRNANDLANTAIQNRMNEYSTCLAEITEELEGLLFSHRENLSLQQRASFAYDAMLRITAWLEERLRSVQKFDFTILEQDETIFLEEETLTRLEKEQSSISARLEKIKSQDMERALEVVRLLEIEIDQTNSVSIDRSTLVDGVERLENSYQELKEAIHYRHLEITIVRKRIVWESEWDEAHQAINNLAQKLWEFNTRYAQYDPDNLKKRNSNNTDSSDIVVTEEIEVKKENVLQQLEDQVTKLETELNIITSDIAFNELCLSYNDYNNDDSKKYILDRIESKQHDIKKQFDHLKLLSSYVSATLKQNNEIKDVVELSDKIQIEGQEAQEEVQINLRETSSSANSTSTTSSISEPLYPNKHTEQRLSSIRDEVVQLCDRSNAMQYLEGGNWFESSQPQNMIQPGEYNSQIKQLFSKKIDELNKLRDSMDRILSTYQCVDATKTKLEEYQTNAGQVQDWIEKMTEAINQRHIDVAAASTTANLNLSIVLERKKANAQSLLEVKSFEFTDILPLQQNLGNLLKDVIQNAPSFVEETTEACKNMHESITRSFQFLQQSISNEALVLDTAEIRQQWETEIEEDQCRIDFMNHQLQQYILKKSKCVAQQDALSSESVQELVSERSAIDEQCQRFRSENTNALTDQFDKVKNMYIKLPLTKSIPTHLQERMETFVHNLKKLEDALVWREKELEYIQQRCELESNINHAMTELEECRKAVSVFVESKARWTPDCTEQPKNQNPNADSTDTQWIKEQEKFKTYQTSLLTNIKSQYDHLNQVSSTLKLGFMSELHAKKMELLVQAEDGVQADLTFAHDVVAQRNQVLSFIDKTSELEKLADTIRESFLSVPVVDSTQNPQQVAQLENFRSQVEKIKQLTSSDVLFPKRSNEGDIAMPTKVKDKTMNSVVQDVISTKICRLEELVESLSTLLKSQQVWTRLQYVLKTFNKQLHTCETWITFKQSILEKSVHILDDENLSLDVDHLRDAVSEADSIQTAMSAHDNNFTLLSKYRENYIQVFDEQGLLSEQEKEEKMEEFDQVYANYERVCHQWDDLLLETRQVSGALSAALLPAELNNRITSLMSSFDLLSASITSTQEASITDVQISEWQKRIDYLETKEYNRLHSEVAEYKHTISVDMIDPLMQRLDNAGDTVLEIRAKLSNLYDSINANRLRNTHADNSDLFHKSAQKVILLISELQGSEYSLITDKKSAIERAQHFKNLDLEHKQIKKTFLECQGYFDDSSSYYNGIRVQDVNTPESEMAQRKVEEGWHEVQTKNTELSAFVTRISKWIEGCDMLDKLEADLNTIKADIEKITPTLHKPSTSNDSKLQKFEKQLAKVAMRQDELESTVKSTSDMAQDEENKVGFFKCSNKVRDLSASIQSMLEKRRLDKERKILFEMFKDEISKTAKACEDQISYIRQQSNTNPEHHLKKIDSINSIINAYSTALNHIQDNYSEFKAKYDGVISDYATKLVNTFEHSSADVENHKLGLDKLLKELQSSLKTENDYITSLKLLARLMRFGKEISKSINELKSGISRSPVSSRSASSRSARNRNFSELKEFVQRYESIEGSVSEFYQKCDDIKKSFNKRISLSRTAEIARVVDKRKEDMKIKWAEIKSSADENRERLDVMQKRQLVSSKLAESLRYVDDLKERVNTLQLSGKSISVEVQDLDEVQEEIDVTLKSSLNGIDAIIKKLSHSDIVSLVAPTEVSIKVQRESLSQSIEELRQLVEHRLKQAHTEGSITEFCAIVDQIDSEIMILSKIIDSTSTQHASVEGSKFNKTDLQKLLKKLLTEHKKSEPKINELLVKAKSEAQKQFLDDNERVAKRLGKTLKDWSNIQASVSSREKELQTCIKELNHEFFTKLAMAKSTPRDRKLGKNASNSTHLPLPASGRTFRSSTLSTEMKMTVPNSARRSKTPYDPANSRNNKGASYVPDPKNELDVHLGKIVNGSPFRMKVKMVKGEVGKYWFGDEHPRLVYCRILPSKMVMVRVGGGWVELSRFMKDHGHSDGLATKTDSGETQYISVSTFSDETNNSPSYSVTTRSGSPMGPVVGVPIIRRGSGVSSSLTNRSNSSSGYVEGDRFIQTDEEGNQVALKMVKADSNPKPLSPNKKRGGR